jgi:hypothetical protein
LCQNERRTAIVVSNKDDPQMQSGGLHGTLCRPVMKDVLGANGRAAEICQRSIEIETPSREQAVELAKIRFCETEKVKDWLLHADRVRMADVEIPS